MPTAIIAGMAFDEAALARLRDLFTGRADAEEKRMVGGRSFVVGGRLCCGVSGDALMVRVGPERLEWALSQPHVRPMMLGGKRLSGHVLVDPPGYASESDLRVWIDRALDFIAQADRSA